MSWYRGWSIAILSLSILIFITSLVMYRAGSLTKNPDVDLVLSPNKSTYKVGEQFVVNIYFQGKDAGAVLVSDLSINFDQKMLSLVGADAGPYYNQPLKPLWNLKMGKLTLAADPHFVQTKNPSASVAKLKFVAQKEGETQISFDPKNEVFVSEAKKGVYRKLVTGYYEVVK